MADSAPFYRKAGTSFAGHETVNYHDHEYVRGNVTTNSIEGFFGVLKLGIRGVYQYVSPEHLNSYVSEFAFRYNNRKSRGVEDSERADNLLAGVVGTRLTYETID